MRVVMALIIGVTAAQAGFGAGLVGTILVGPWTGRVFSAITAGYAMGMIAMLVSFSIALRVHPRRTGHRFLWPVRRRISAGASANF